MNFRLTRRTLDRSASALALIFVGLLRACG